MSEIGLVDEYLGLIRTDDPVLQKARDAMGAPELKRQSKRRLELLLDLANRKPSEVVGAILTVIFEKVRQFVVPGDDQSLGFGVGSAHLVFCNAYDLVEVLGETAANPLTAHAASARPYAGSMGQALCTLFLGIETVHSPNITSIVKRIFSEARPLIVQWAAAYVLMSFPEEEVDNATYRAAARSLEACLDHFQPRWRAKNWDVGTAFWNTFPQLLAIAPRHPELL